VFCAFTREWLDGDVVQAALDANAHRIDVRLEAPTESRP
jgi:hypothetical protein